MARDRQRAKQRKQRREPTPPSREPSESDLIPDARALHRENVPGPVEHTGDVDQAEAAIVAGAGGTPPDEPLDETTFDEDGDRDGAGDGGREEAVVATGRVATPSENAAGSGGGRFLNFLRACWAELQRVQWPDRRQVGQATMVVLGFVLIAGAFLGFADFVAERVVDLII